MTTPIMSKADIETHRQQIAASGELLIHLLHSRTGLRCTARIWHTDGQRTALADGGGYDKEGAALGQTIARLFGPELSALPRDPSDPTRVLAPDGTRIIGVYYYGKSAALTVDGACGLESMLALLRVLGFASVRAISTSRLSTLVLATGRQINSEVSNG